MQQPPAPPGSPCWVDLSTDDIETARMFYPSLFGWEASEPYPDVGGYVMFARTGTPIAGGAPNSEDSSHPDAWTTYLLTDDATALTTRVEQAGGQVLSGPHEVATLGTMAIVSDPGGAVVGVWQANELLGFRAGREVGMPRWFDLQTRDYAATVAFYQEVFCWETQVMSDTASFRYTVLERSGEQLAGIMDAVTFLPPGVPAHWTVVFGVESADATAALCEQLGGHVLAPAEDSPYGRLATLADPSGATFRVVAIPG